MKYSYITIEGNIGSGKTTLSKMIAAECNGKLVLERFEDNSFLPKFYKDPEKYAFPLEMSFLADRFQQLKTEVTDRDIFTSFTIADYFINKSLIFAKNNLQNDEFQLYARLFEIINGSLPKPGLIVYLFNTVENLLSNIRKRGRNYEQEISYEYLANIQQGYFDYFRTMKNQRVVIIDTQSIDFVKNSNDYDKIISVIEKEYNFGIHRITFL
ncbi:MAG: deoxynucleoside kinase [Bacteroidales bacterium]|nr:deoxynucleoside kinase [Bacteroidales bacterium]